MKLWERPTPHELVKQLEVVLSKLPEIFSSGTALNIWMERDQKASPANAEQGVPQPPSGTQSAPPPTGAGTVVAQG